MVLGAVVSQVVGEGEDCKLGSLVVWSAEFGPLIFPRTPKLGLMNHKNSSSKHCQSPIHIHPHLPLRTTRYVFRPPSALQVARENNHACRRWHDTFSLYDKS